MDKDFFELAKRIDEFMYNYDYYNYADDVGISAEERNEHIEHLEHALRNNEFSPMIDIFRDIVKEESLCENGDTKNLDQAKDIFKDLTELSKDFEKELNKTLNKTIPDSYKTWTPPRHKEEFKNRETQSIDR